MLKLTIPETELYDDAKEEFVYSKQKTLQLEHSLVSISKWEAKWEKPFMSKDEKTIEETLDYIRCMTINPNVEENTYNLITNEMLDTIKQYIDSKRTATTYHTQKGGNNKETITSELIYYWMVSYNIPFECQKWHLNRLLTLINVCNIKNAPPKKQKRSQIASEHRRINEQRRAQMNSRG